MRRSAPIIIIGMHRSGTTMVTNMLQRLGLHIGKNLEPNDEDWLFINLNEWLLRQSGGAWDQPEPVQELLSHPEVRTMIGDYLQYHLRSWWVASFTGVKRYLQGETPMSMTIPWGWKDPRNTFTLPFWLEIFPEARILHIYRHGVDVANSLLVRERKWLEQHQRKHNRRMRLRAYYLFKKTGGFTNSPRCLDLLGGFTLWESYVSKAIEYTNSLPNASLTVKYEAFIRDPEEQLAEVAAFCGLQAPSGRISNVASEVMPDRGRAFERDAELVAFFDQVRDNKLLKQLGY
jgi:hypothetical protein